MTSSNITSEGSLVKGDPRVRARDPQGVAYRIGHTDIHGLDWGVRTTVRLDDRLLADAKRYAAHTGRTLTSLIDEGLRDLLARRAAPLPAGRTTLPTGGRGGLQPGVTLDSNAALLDVMDRSRDPA